LKERRQFIRVPKRGLLRFRAINLPKELLEGDEAFYQNISPGGIQFESAQPLACDTMLKLEIELRDWSRHLPDGDRHMNLPLKLLGKVVHCEEVVPRAAYNIGIQFVGLEPKYQTALLQYLQDSFKNA
jgi:hypothetical protein